MSKTSGWLLVLVLAVVGFAWWSLGVDAGDVAAPAVVVTEDPSSPAATMTVPEGRDAPVEELAPGPVDAPPGDEATEEAGHRVAAHDAEDAPPSVTVGGRVVRLDESDVERPTGDGGFRVRAWRENSSRHDLSVDVVAGRWSSEFPEGTALEAWAFSVDGRPARLVRANAERVESRGHRIAVPVDGVLDLYVRTIAASLLHVRSARSGAELSDVELLACNVWEHGRAPHEAEQDARCRSLDGLVSPLDLDALIVGDSGRRATRQLWARAPDHAWGSLEIDFQRGGERTLHLEDGGELELVVSGVRAADHSRARLYRSGEGHHRPVRERLLVEDGAVLVESLPPGHYRISTEVGEWFRQPRVLATAEVEVRPGERSTVTLVLESAGEIVRVPLAGRVVVPEAWGLERLSLSAELLDTPLGGQEARLRVQSDAMDAVPDEPGTWAWRLPDVQPGRWRIGLYRPDFDILVEVGPAGDEDVLLEIPPPGRVELTLRDAGTGLVVEPERVMWHSKRPEGVHGGSVETVRPDDDGRYVWSAPQGEISVDVWDPAYASASETFVVRPGLNTGEIELRRICSVVLSVRDGDALVPWDYTWGRVKAVRVGDPGSTAGRAEHDGVLTVRLTVPGTWRLRLPEIPGFEPVLEQVVEVPPGGSQELVVDLTRRR